MIVPFYQDPCIFHFFIALRPSAHSGRLLPPWTWTPRPAAAGEPFTLTAVLSTGLLDTINSWAFEASDHFWSKSVPMPLLSSLALSLALSTTFGQP